MKRAITHLKLAAANQGKLGALDRVAGVYAHAVQRFVDGLIAVGVAEPNAYGEIPGDRARLVGPPAAESQLSERWRRCAWQQACGVVRSWFANHRRTPPVINQTNFCIQANRNVGLLEAARTATGFDFRLRVSTLEKGHPVWLPIKLYRRGGAVLTSFPKLCSGVTLNRRDGVWYATLVVEKPNRKAAPQTVVGIDLGLVNFVARSDGECFGGLDDQLQRRIEQATERRRRKQKLNACLQNKGLPEVPLDQERVNATIRNRIGQALNQCLDSLPAGAAVALERLKVKDMRMKSRLMNRRLRAGQIGFARDRLRAKLDERGIRYKSVQAAFSSQQCPACGFTINQNRPTQAQFHCLWCGFDEHADVVGAVNVAKRFHDTDLNAPHFRQVEEVLVKRFLRRHIFGPRPPDGVAGCP